MITRGLPQKIARGDGWYDHEFGGPTAEQIKQAQEREKEKKPREDIAWNWLGLQLDDGTDVTASSLVDAKTGKLRWQWGDPSWARPASARCRTT